VKLPEFLKKFRLRSVQVGEDVRSQDNVDGLAATGHAQDVGDWGAGPSAPVNWVPSQQDEKPEY
jgi:hypothetical protein